MPTAIHHLLGCGHPPFVWRHRVRSSDARETRKYDPDFRAGAVGIVRETNRSVAQVARDLGINPGTLAHCVAKDKIARGEKLDLDLDLDLDNIDPERVRQLEAENAELRMERVVLKRSVVLWVKEATR